jgi:hypothetical protein
VALIGIYVINAQIYTRPIDNKVTAGAYEICYVKQTAATASYILDSELLKEASIE